MSQKKVDEYKDYKKNRKKNIGREKVKDMAGNLVTWVVAALLLIAVIVGIGAGLYDSYQVYVDSRPDYSSTTYILSDLTGVLEDTEEEETEEDTEEETDEASEETEEETEETSEETDE